MATPMAIVRLARTSSRRSAALWARAEALAAAAWR
jgi:hypothetical protein